MEALATRQEHPPDAAQGGPLQRKLRLGLFMDQPRQPRPIADAFARLAASDYVEIVLIACDDASAEPGPWLWRGYRWLDERLFRAGAADDWNVDLPARVPHRRFLHLNQCDVRWVAHAGALQLDVAFALGGFDDYALERVARFGCWRYFFGEPGQCLGDWAGFNEVTADVPVLHSGIRVRWEPGPAACLVYQSWARTYPLSVARNREQLIRKTAQFAERALKELHRGGEQWLAQCPSLSMAGRLPEPPAPAQIRQRLSHLGAKLVRRVTEKLTRVEQWCLAYRFDGVEPWQGDLAGFSRLLPPRDRFWADPFPLEREGRYYVFFEELLFDTGRGHIAMIELDRSGRCTTPQVVLQRDCHLSYPFLIEDAGELYMVPESGESRTVEIYRCVGFPDRWEPVKVLLKGLWCVDATFHRHQDKWWMFVNIGVEGAEIHDELHLYYADQLLGEWTPHPASPIKSDVRGARPAGRLYCRDGVLYRPAQICAPLYGSGMILHKVVEMDTERYREEEAARIVPDGRSGLLGLHTFNRAGDLCIIDGFLRRRRLFDDGSASPLTGAAGRRQTAVLPASH